MSSGVPARGTFITARSQAPSGVRSSTIGTMNIPLSTGKCSCGSPTRCMQRSTHIARLRNGCMSITTTIGVPPTLCFSLSGHVAPWTLGASRAGRRSKCTSKCAGRRRCRRRRARRVQTLSARTSWSTWRRSTVIDLSKRVVTSINLSCPRRKARVWKGCKASFRRTRLSLLCSSWHRLRFQVLRVKDNIEHPGS